MGIKLKNNQNMKFVKFGILALSLGLFVASCGNGESTDATTNDTTTVAPAPETAPVTTPVDSPATAPVVDSPATSAVDTPAKH